MTPDLWAPVIDVHLNGAYNVTSAAWPHMRAQGYGRVVCTASGAGIFGNFGQANYAAAKMGLVGFTRVLAVEGARNNIKANVIAPVARTRMTEDMLGPLADKMDPKFVSPIVAYLVHESCEATGRIFSVAGGRVAEIFIGEGPGYTDPNLTPESIVANWDAITRPRRVRGAHADGRRDRHLRQAPQLSGARVRVVSDTTRTRRDTTSSHEVRVVSDTTRTVARVRRSRR